MCARHVAPLAAGATVEAGDVLAQAFVDDPLMRYYFEGDQDRSVPVCKTMTLATGLTLRYGTALRLDCGARLVGVALLLPPHVRDFPFSAVVAAVLTTPSLWRPRALNRHFGVASSIQAHRPTFPCWTLVSLGIKPPDQHRGNGSALLAHILHRLAAGSSICLETDNERNLPLYLRFGFTVTSEFAAHGGRGPRTWAMLRSPAPSALPDSTLKRFNEGSVGP
jgi:ribosomal protein S18 acetylase RimI-like enzyme